MQLTFSYTTSSARAVLVSPTELTEVRVTFTGQGYRLVTCFMLSLYQRLMELCSSGLHSGHSYCVLDHLYMWLVPRKGLEYTAHHLKSLHYSVNRYTHGSEMRYSRSEGYNSTSGSDSQRRHKDSKQHYRSDVCNNGTVYQQNRTYLENPLCCRNQACLYATAIGTQGSGTQLCLRSEECPSATITDSQGNENPQSRITEACFDVTTTDSQGNENPQSRIIEACFDVTTTDSQGNANLQSRITEACFDVTTSDSQGNANLQSCITEACFDVATIDSQGNANLQSCITEACFDVATTDSQDSENLQSRLAEACFDVTTSDSQDNVNLQGRITEACPNVTTTDSQRHNSENQQCCNGEDWYSVIRDSQRQDSKNQQSYVSEAFENVAITDSQGQYTESPLCSIIFNGYHNWGNAESTTTALIFGCASFRKGTVLGNAIYSRCRGNSCSNRQRGSYSNCFNNNEHGKDNDKCSSNKREHNHNMIIHNDNNNNYKVKDTNDICKNNNNARDIDNNKGEFRYNVYNNSKEQEIDNNYNNNKKEDDNDTNCPSNEFPLTASDDVCQTNIHVQTDGFVCDIMTTPTVLSSADRVYHLASNRLSGFGSSRVDTFLPTPPAHFNSHHKQNNDDSTSDHVSLRTVTSGTDISEDLLLPRALSIAGIGDNDAVLNVDFLKEYSVKVEDSNPSFLDEADRFVETIFAKSHQLGCSEMDLADCAMSHTCTGLTLEILPASEVSTQSAREVTALHLNTEPQSSYPIDTSASCCPLHSDCYNWTNDGQTTFIPRRDAFSHFPDSFSQLPDSFSQLPDSYSQLPDSFSQLPDSFSQLPDSFSQLPDSFSQLPDSFSQLPDSFSQPSDSFSHLPDSFRQLSDSFSQNPYFFRFRPDSHSNPFHSSSLLPVSTRHGLDSFSQVTDSFIRIPDSFGRLPDSTSHGFNSCRNLPSVFCHRPDLRCNFHKSFPYLPESTSHCVDSNGNLPFSLTHLPDSTSNLPHSLSHLPDSCSDLTDSCNYLPDLCSNLLDSCNPLSNSTSQGPRKCNHPPDSCSNSPDSCQNLPDSCSNFPDSRSNFPGLRSNLYNDLHDSRSNSPHISSNLPESFSNHPDSLSNFLDVRSNVPDSCSNHPDSFSNHPDSLSNFLDVRSNIPDSCSNHPNSFSNHPDSLSNFLGVRSNVPDSCSNHPDSCSNHPDSFSNHPDSLSNFLDVRSNVPDSCGNLSDSLRNHTNSLSNFLDVRSNVPDSCSNHPDSFINHPDSLSNFQDVRSNIPDSCSNLSDSFSNHLDSLSNFLDVRSNIPDSCSNYPDSFSNHPGSLSNFLDVRSNLRDPCSHISDSCNHRHDSVSLNPDSCSDRPRSVSHRSETFSLCSDSKNGPFYSHSQGLDLFSNYPDSRSVGPDSWGVGPDSWSAGTDSWSDGPDSWSVGPDSWSAGTDCPKDTTELAVCGSLDHEPLDPEGFEQSSLSEVIVTSLQLLNHTDLPPDKCLQNVNTVPWRENISEVAGDQFAFTQNSHVVNEALGSLPDTEMWPDQPTASEADDRKLRRQSTSSARLDTSRDSVGHLRTQFSDLEHGQTSTPFARTDEQSRVENEESVVGGNASSTLCFMRTRLQTGRASCSLTRSAPFKARSLFPNVEGLLASRQRKETLAKTSSYNTRQRNCFQDSDKGTRETAGSRLASAKCNSKVASVGPSKTPGNIPTNSTFHNVPPASHPLSGQSTSGATRTHKNRTKPTSGRCKNVTAVRQGSVAADRRSLRKRKSAPEHTTHDLTSTTEGEAGLIKPKLASSDLNIEGIEATNVEGKTPGHVGNNKCTSGRVVTAGHDHLLTAKSSQNGRAVCSDDSITSDLGVEITQYVTRGQSDQRKNIISESSQEQIGVGVDGQQQSLTMADSAKVETAVEEDWTESVKDVSAGVRGRSSCIGRFLETRDATVSSFTQQMILFSPGLLKGRRSNDLWDKYKSRNKIATQIPKQVQHFKYLQLRQVRRWRNKQRGGAEDQTVTRPEVAVETDRNNHANYETSNPVSTSRSKIKPKIRPRLVSGEGLEINTNQQAGHVQLAKDQHRLDHQNLEPDEQRIHLPNIHQENRVSFLDSQSDQAGKPLLKKSGSHDPSSGSTLFSIILEELRTSKENPRARKESPPSAHRIAAADTSQGNNFLPRINCQGVKKVGGTNDAKTIGNQERQGMTTSSSVSHARRTTYTNHFGNSYRQMKTSCDSIKNCRVKQTAPKRQSDLVKTESLCGMKSPSGIETNGQNAGHFQHHDRHVTKHKLKATLRPKGNTIKTGDRTGAVQPTFANPEKTQYRDIDKNTESIDSRKPEINSQIGDNANIHQPGVQASGSTASARTCTAESRKVPSGLSKSQCPVPKRNRPLKPLKPEIAEIVNRLASRPPSTDSRLLMMIGNWEQEYGQPLNINQQLDYLVEDKLRRQRKPNPRRTVRHQWQTKHSFPVPGPPPPSSHVSCKATTDRQTPSVSIDSLRFNSPVMSTSDMTQKPCPDVEDNDDDFSELLQ